VRLVLHRPADRGRTFGLFRMGRVAPRWLVHRVFTTYVRDLTAPLPDLPSPTSWVRTAIRKAHVPELEQMDPAMTLPSVRRRWSEGQEGCLWSLDGSPAHYDWVARGPLHLPYLHLTFRPIPGDVFVVDAFTRADLRRRGVDAVSGVDHLRRMKTAGLRRSVCVVAWWNIPAHRVSQRRMGYGAVGTIGVRHRVVTRRHFATGLVRLDDRRGFTVLPAAPAAGGSGP
jgi:hypothetical protein